QNLKDKYQVLLTRSDDSDLPLADRTALANHHKALLFISIHLAGAFRSDIKGSIIMYYSPFQSEKNDVYTDMSELSTNHDMPSGQWKNNQLNHIPASRRMAERLRLELKQSSSAISPSVNNAEIYVLSGATMPALYLEPFYLTHPDSERHFKKSENLERLAKDMALGIEATLKNEGL
ncbi:MAG: N-acetylmuramoyl-L-alanine amidase, partial [Desulfobacteraceae bacterium]